MKWRRSSQKRSAVEKQWHTLCDSRCSWNSTSPPQSKTLIFLVVRSWSLSVYCLVSFWCRNSGTTNTAVSVARTDRMRGKTKCFNCYVGRDSRGNFLRNVQLIRMEKCQWSSGLGSFHVQLVWQSGPKPLVQYSNVSQFSWVCLSQGQDEQCLLKTQSEVFISTCFSMILSVLVLCFLMSWCMPLVSGSPHLHFVSHP